MSSEHTSFFAFTKPSGDTTSVEPKDVSFFNQDESVKLYYEYNYLFFAVQPKATDNHHILDNLILVSLLYQLLVDMVLNQAT